MPTSSPIMTTMFGFLPDASASAGVAIYNPAATPMMARVQFLSKCIELLPVERGSAAVRTGRVTLIDALPGPWPHGPYARRGQGNRSWCRAHGHCRVGNAGAM